MCIFRVVLMLVLLGALPAQAAPGWQNCGPVSKVAEVQGGVDVIASGREIHLRLLAENVLHVRYGPKGPLCVAHPEAFGAPPPVKMHASADAVTLSTTALQVRLDRATAAVSVLDASGSPICVDDPQYPVSFNGRAFRVWKTMPADEHYFALGDKSGPLDRRNQAFTMWNFDHYSWQESTDPMYKSVPFVLGVNKGRAYGLFLDDSFRSSFDFGKESSTMWSFGAEGGILDYYVIVGPAPKRVLTDFTKLVGRMPIPPLWSLGYQQSRGSYMTEDEVLDIASKLRKHRIPTDVIYLDGDYKQDSHPFTVDSRRFAHLSQMVKTLLARGFKTVVSLDPYLAKKPGHRPYDEGLAKGYFIRNPDGTPYFGRCWPGDVAWADFSRAEVRRWWGLLHADLLDAGVRGIWDDMNEPAAFERADGTVPLDRVHVPDGQRIEHREVHNLFAYFNTWATYEGMRALRPDLRPFVLTRSGFAGSQRFAATWTGDNVSTWNHMRLSVPQLLNLGLSGMAFAGDDIGGFNGFTGGPSAELLTRWMQLGAFNPLYRNHSLMDSRSREPWVDGPLHEAARRRTMEARYRLLPYIYSCMEEASRTGVPLMRPMFLEFPNDASMATQGETFMFGPDLLVAPRLWDIVSPYPVALPAGTWYDYWTHQALAGGKAVKLDPPLETIPVFVRAGAVVAHQPLVQSTAQTPRGPLELQVYAGAAGGASVYLDDGETMAYTRGQSTRLEVEHESLAGGLDLSLRTQGAWRPWCTEISVRVVGLDRVETVTVDGHAVTGWRRDGRDLVIDAVRFGPHVVRVRGSATAGVIRQRETSHGGGRLPPERH